MIRRYVLSGCSGGGKSTLIAALAGQGYQTFPEPGRIIVAQELASGGTALPWTDPAAFSRRALEMSLTFYNAAVPPVAFYDRSFLEPLVGLPRIGLPVPREFADLAQTHRYDNPVFLVPPWPEIYTTDAERQHAFDAAVAEYDSLVKTLPALGYEVEIIPQMSVEQRVAWLLARVNMGRE